MNVIKLTDSRLVQNQVQYEAEPNTFHYLVVIPELLKILVKLYVSVYSR